MTTRKRTAVLISGRGSNLQALMDAAADPGYPAEIALVLSNVADAPGLMRAAGNDIPTRTIPHVSFATRELFDAEVDNVLRGFAVDFVCLAGFMRILSNGFAGAWHGRMINIHPSLLPAFKGVNVHRRVLDSGVRISGCTVHFVVPELDSGPIIAQAAVPVLSDDTEEALAARTLSAEHKLYPHALKLLSRGGVTLEDGCVRWNEPGHAAGELFSPRL